MTAVNDLAFDLVIFDWDGTLYDSVSQIVQSLQWAAAQHDITLCGEAAQNIIGLGLPEVMQVLFPDYGDQHASIQAAYGSHYVANLQAQQWFDGVESLLKQLKARGVLMAVATGKNRIGLDRVLAQTQSEGYFAVTRCAGETRSKPNPLMLQEILMETGITVDRAVLVGDTTYDLHMAKNIDMARIGVTYGAHDQQALATCEPLAIVHSIEQLTKLLLPS